MPLPLLFIGIAAASGMFGIGGTVKAGFDAKNARQINKSANELVQKSTDYLNAQRLTCGNSLTRLGGRKNGRLERNDFRLFECVHTDQKCGFQGDGRAG